MTIRQIRNQINAIKRKFALPLTVLRLRRKAEKFCDDWAIALDQKKPIEPHTQVFQFANTGPRLSTYGALRRYLQNTHRQNQCPHPYDLIRALLPKTHETGLLRAIMTWDLPAH